MRERTEFTLNVAIVRVTGNSPSSFRIGLGNSPSSFRIGLGNSPRSLRSGHGNSPRSCGNDPAEGGHIDSFFAQSIDVGVDADGVGHNVPSDD